MVGGGADARAESLLLAADAGLHPLAREWVGVVDRLANLRAELSFQLGEGESDPAYAEEFARNLPVAGAVPADYLNRWLAVGADLAVLAGPRFRGRDPNWPFVEIVGGTRPITPADLPVIVAAVRPEFAVFMPREIRLWTAEPVGAWPGTGGDLRLVVGRLGDLRARPTPAGLTAVRPVDDGYYERYRIEFARRCAENPEHTVFTRLESVADLEELRKAGTLLEVLVDGRPAGLLAARPDQQRGLPGHTVVELMLYAEARGRGHGAAMSTLLASTLDASDDVLLLGTIHHRNAPAYRSALRAGRHDVGGEVVVPLLADG